MKFGYNYNYHVRPQKLLSFGSRCHLVITAANHLCITQQHRAPQTLTKERVTYPRLRNKFLKGAIHERTAPRWPLSLISADAVFMAVFMRVTPGARPETRRRDGTTWP